MGGFLIKRKRPSLDRATFLSFACMVLPYRFTVVNTHRPLSSPFLGLPNGILNINQKKELLSGLWVLIAGSSLLQSLVSKPKP